MEGSSPVGQSSSSEDEESWSEGGGGSENVLKANEETDSDYSSSSCEADDGNFTSLSWPPNGDHYPDRAFSLSECFEEDHIKHSSSTLGIGHSSCEDSFSTKLSCQFLKNIGKFLKGRHQVQEGGDDLKQFLISREENFNQKRRDSFINMQAIFLCAQLLSIAFLHLFYLDGDITNEQEHRFPLIGGEIKTLTTAIFGSEGTTPALFALSAMSWTSTLTTSDYRFQKHLHRCSLLALLAFQLYSHQTTPIITPPSFPRTIHTFIFKFATPATLIYTSIEPDYLAIVFATLLSLNVAASLEEPNSSSSSNTTLIITGITAVTFNTTLFALRASFRKEDFTREYNSAAKRRQTELTLISSYAQLHHTPLNFLQRIASTTRQMIDSQHTVC